MKPVEIEFLVKNNTRQGLSGVSGGIDAVDKDAAQARGRIQALKDEIVRLQKVIAQTPEMDQTENIRQIEALQRQLQALQAATKRTDLVPASAPAAVRTYNGLNMSIQQLARELPVLSMGPQMFFMAISNNLPIFTDELARARKEYEAMIASGQKGVPVWRQVLSSLPILANGVSRRNHADSSVRQGDRKLGSESVSGKEGARHRSHGFRTFSEYDARRGSKRPAGGRKIESSLPGRNG